MKRPIWTEAKIREGIDRFIKEHGHGPTARDIDQVNYLPTSRMIQKRFGGLPKLRLRLGYSDIHFGRGSFRSEIASNCNRRGRDTEIKFELELGEIFGEVFVHTEKIFGTLKNRVDFYVYTPSGNFGVDIFYPSNMRTLQCIINIKMDKYSGFTEPLYFVTANEEMPQESLDYYKASKKKHLSSNMMLLTTESFFKLAKNMRIYPNPLFK